MTFWQWVKYILLATFLPNSLVRMEWRMLRLLNKDRKDFGLSKLGMQADLREVAKNHSKDMVKKDYFEHVNLKGETPADRLKVQRVTDVVSGENLAKIGGYPNPVVEAEEGLMKSPGHRANILNKKYNCVGIGIIKSKDDIYYFTQNFAKRVLKFTKKIRKRVSLKRGLRLKGFSFEPLSGIYYKVTFSCTAKALYKGVINLRDDHFDFNLNFGETGRFEVSLFAMPKENPEDSELANKFEVKVMNWWFWF